MLHAAMCAPFPGQTGFAALTDKELLVTMSFASAGAIATNGLASSGVRLQKQGTRPGVHLY